MSSTVKISIIILFKKKDVKFKQALHSAQFAQEILAIKNTHITDFSQIRNQALKKATHKWVFFLDSDEIIARNSIPEIKKIIQNDSADGIRVHRQDIFYHQTIKHGEAGNMKLLRMGKKNKMSWQRPVHEIAIIDGITHNSTIQIIHQAHKSIDDFIASIINYAEAEAQYRINLNKSPSFLQLIMFPIIKFIHNYILKKGFLDGWRGLSYALVMSLHSFSVRVCQYELKYKQNHEKNI